VALAGRRTWRDGDGHDTFVAAFTAWMAEHAGSHHAWLAEASAAPVGMAWLAVVNRVPGPGRWLRLSGNLQSVYVIPERRGAGVGRLLVDAAIAMARDSGIDYVSVHPSERSFPLYRRARFNDYPGVLELRWD